MKKIYNKRESLRALTVWELRIVCIKRKSKRVPVFADLRSQTAFPPVGSEAHLLCIDVVEIKKRIAIRKVLLRCVLTG